MQDREKLESLVKSDEGLRLKPYFDTATPPKLTIGYGRNLDDNGISEQEATYLFNNDLARTEGQLLHALPWTFRLIAPRYAVLVSMAYNMGIYRFLKFEKTLRAAEKGDYEEAARQILDSDAARKLPKRYRRLAVMMRTGEWLN